MNVIVVCMDTLRWDALGCYRADWVETPCIDAFAEDATRFDAAYCASFPTIPMRTDAFTGNVNWPIYGWKDLGNDEVSITECVKDAGYATAFVHDTHNMVPTGFGRAFDDDILIERPDGWEANIASIEPPVPLGNMRQGGQGFLRDRAYMAMYECEAQWPVAETMLTAARWLEENHRRERFFLWVDTFEIHEDWYPPAHYVDWYDPHYEGLDYSYPNYGYTDIYEPHELARLRHRYAAEVTLTDRWVGHLLRQVELCGLLDSTMVLLVSDHGMYIGEHRRTGKHSVDASDPWPIYDEVGRIPLLVRMPGGARVKRTSALTQAADIAATIADVTGATVPEMLGRSLAPALSGEAMPSDGYVFSSCHSGPGPGRIEYLPSCITVTGPRWTLVTGPEGWDAELYDRRRDPGQVTNVIGEHPRIAERMRRALESFMRERGADSVYVGGFARL